MTQATKAQIAKQIREEEAAKKNHFSRLDKDGNPLPTLAERLKTGAKTPKDAQ